MDKLGWSWTLVFMARTEVSRTWFRAQLLHSLGLRFSACKMHTMSSLRTGLQEGPGAGHRKHWAPGLAWSSPRVSEYRPLRHEQTKN